MPSATRPDEAHRDTPCLFAGTARGGARAIQQGGGDEKAGGGCCSGEVGGGGGGDTAWDEFIAHGERALATDSALGLSLDSAQVFRCPTFSQPQEPPSR